ncbi:MAG: hypothetical protein PHI53_01390 [Candidatus Pacebacteria bacterium]|nr:hypothetical protein [Candidatus Paceibacterota bacterium]
MNNFGIIIQARMESKRLPHKVIEEIMGKTMIEHVISRCKESKLSKKTVVAIADTPLSSKLVPIIKRSNAYLYKGSLENVLDRYIKAAERFKIDPIIRITGDCPLIDPNLIDSSIKRYNSFKKPLDYFFIYGYPRGLGDIEIFSLKGLKKAASLTNDSSHLEHVFGFFSENPAIFDIKILKAPKKFYFPNLRLCVDEAPDILLIREIFSRFKKDKGLYTPKILEYLNQNPELLEINKEVKQAPLR